MKNSILLWCLCNVVFGVYGMDVAEPGAVPGGAVVAPDLRDMALRAARDIYTNPRVHNAAKFGVVGGGLMLAASVGYQTLRFFTLGIGRIGKSLVFGIADGAPGLVNLLEKVRELQVQAFNEFSQGLVSDRIAARQIGSWLFTRGALAGRVIASGVLVGVRKIGTLLTPAASLMVRMDGAFRQHPFILLLGISIFVLGYSATRAVILMRDRARREGVVGLDRDPDVLRRIAIIREWVMARVRAGLR